jgi:hypothetical protein
MMRWLSLALLLSAGCHDDAPQCKPGTLLLSMILVGSSLNADTILIQGSIPAFMQKVSRVPSPPGTPHVVVNIVAALPDGYRTGEVVFLEVKSLAAGQLIDDAPEEIRLVAGCTVAGVQLGDPLFPIDDDAGIGDAGD